MMPVVRFCYASNGREPAIHAGGSLSFSICNIDESNGASMPSRVENCLCVWGDPAELRRFLGRCFRTNPETRTVEFDLARLLPVSDEEEMDDGIAARVDAGKNGCDAARTVVRHKHGRCFEVHFVTPSVVPEPLYRKLGIHFPRLRFFISAIDPDVGAWEGEISGIVAEFGPAEDFDAVFDRFFIRKRGPVTTDGISEETQESSYDFGFLSFERKYS